MSDRTSNEKLLNELEKLAEEIGDTPTSSQMNEYGEYSATLYQTRFGSWNNALQEAGFDPNQEYELTDDELLQSIRDLADEVGRTPTKTEMNERGDHYSRTYLDHFGSWNEAVRLAGLRPNAQIGEDEFKIPPDNCPLCEEIADAAMDFHHWRYGARKKGCYLCRECHDRVHAGDARPQEDPDWLLKSVQNLVELHEENHSKESPDLIAERYNIPSSELVRFAIKKGARD